MYGKKETLKELLAKDLVFAPCIWDFFSARAAELCGFKAALVSSFAVSYSLTGFQI